MEFRVRLNSSLPPSHVRNRHDRRRRRDVLTRRQWIGVRVSPRLSLAKYQFARLKPRNERNENGRAASIKCYGNGKRKTRKLSIMTTTTQHLTDVPNEVYIASLNDCRSTADDDFEDSCLSCDCRSDDSGASADGGDNDDRGRERSAPSPPSLEALLLVAGRPGPDSEPSRPPALSRKTPANPRRRQGAKDDRTRTTGGPGTFKTPTKTADTPRPGAETSELAATTRRRAPPKTAAPGRQRLLLAFADHSPLPFAVPRKANGSLNFTL